MDVSERNCNDIIYISIKLLIFESLGERMMEEEIRSERVWNVVKIFVTFYLYAAGLRTREVKRRETKKKKTRQSDWRKQIHQRKITVEASLSSQILNVKVRHDRWVNELTDVTKKKILFHVFTQETSTAIKSLHVFWNNMFHTSGWEWSMEKETFRIEIVTFHTFKDQNWSNSSWNVPSW